MIGDTGTMRTPTACLLAILACTGPAAAAPADLPALERAWHGCVRAAYGDRPAGVTRASAQRTALDACRAHENAYVAAIMATRAEDGRSLGERAKSWVASVAAYVWDPVTAWVGALRR